VQHGARVCFGFFWVGLVKGWLGQGLVRGLRIQPADYGTVLVNHGFMAWFVAAV
jgi:hypothetical protein